MHHVTPYSVPRLGTVRYRARYCSVLDDVDASDSPLDGILCPVSAQNNPSHFTNPHDGTNGAPIASVRKFAEIQETLIKDAGDTEIGISQHRVFLLGENRWEEPSRLQGRNKPSEASKASSSTRCLTCRGEGRLMCSECDGTGEPNIEPQMRNHSVRRPNAIQSPIKMCHITSYLVPWLGTAWYRAQYCAVLDDVDASDSPLDGILCPVSAQNNLSQFTNPHDGTNGAPIASVRKFAEIQETLIKEAGDTEIGISQHRVFLLGENRWEEPSRLKGRNKPSEGSKASSSTRCLTCRGEGRLMCSECDGSGEPNIEPQFLEWVDEGAKCPYCEGLGYIICDVCEGKNIVQN
ncbi:hypothetical protein MA16_Dca001563 [Dendrobium catenatum]|uniref:Uncharacterized protein n=1 Tax=Dendrobium catenatum TaxID=906689 RepID=A0A2I0WMS5_9ASPA|nr:hypothetical protein MA16_Dca001563 [Dendrobium catenatum]